MRRHCVELAERLVKQRGETRAKQKRRPLPRFLVCKRFDALRANGLCAGPLTLWPHTPGLRVAILRASRHPTPLPACSKRSKKKRGRFASAVKEGVLQTSSQEKNVEPDTIHKRALQKKIYEQPIFPIEKPLGLIKKQKVLGW